MRREKWDHSSGQLSGLLRAFKKGASWWGWRGSLSSWFASRWVLWLAGCFFEMGIFELDASAIITLKVRPLYYGGISVNIKPCICPQSTHSPAEWVSMSTLLQDIIISST